ncbi:class B sortase [Mediterraneibacter glycyrrhizinilyticus]|nr:class B sortase [Mediterraneibacter glycyrrhizinilyticus]
MQETDNSYYQHHTFRKEYNIAGSIFLDARNTAGFSDHKNIIYGYNMRNDSMFHVLRKFQNLDFYQANREI